MLNKLKKIIYRPYAILKIRKKTRKYICSKTDQFRIFLLNIPSHGNLGDHLLSVAEHEFLKNNFPNVQIIPITSADLYYSIKIALSAVEPNDILCITGGGFLGSLYDEEERFLRILKMFPKNKVIVLPQTIYYDDSEKGHKALEKATTYYQLHSSLFVVARDRNTFDLLNNVLMKGRKGNIAFTPDLALYLNKPFNFERDNVLWCLRKDAEINQFNNSIVNELIGQIATLNLKEEYTDTYVPYSIPYEHEIEEVQNKLVQFAHAKLVITDRLHGMIFSAITGTPVIALDNVNGKVGQVYEQWLKNLNYVKFLSNIADSKKIVSQMLSVDDCIYDNHRLMKMYQPIIDFINA